MLPYSGTVALVAESESGKTCFSAHKVEKHLESANHKRTWVRAACAVLRLLIAAQGEPKTARNRTSITEGWNKLPPGGFCPPTL